MIKLSLQHLFALAVAVLFGAIFSAAVTETIFPPAAPNLVPRTVTIMLYAAWISGGMYVIMSAILAIARWRTGRSTPFAVATRVLFLTWGFMIASSVAVGLFDNPTWWSR